MNSRGQTWVGFVMSYGWLIIVILAGTLALFYFGVLNINMFSAPCALPSGFSCLEYSMSATGMTLVIQNTLGSDIVLKSISDLAGNCTAYPGVLLPAQSNAITISGCVHSKTGTMYTTDLELNYTLASGQLYTSKGTVSGQVD